MYARDVGYQVSRFNSAICNLSSYIPISEAEESIEIDIPLHEVSQD